MPNDVAAVLLAVDPTAVRFIYQVKRDDDGTVIKTVTGPDEITAVRKMAAWVADDIRSRVADDYDADPRWLFNPFDELHALYEKWEQEDNELPEGFPTDLHDFDSFGEYYRDLKAAWDANNLHDLRTIVHEYAHFIEHVLDVLDLSALPDEDEESDPLDPGFDILAWDQTTGEPIRDEALLSVEPLERTEFGSQMRQLLAEPGDVDTADASEEDDDQDGALDDDDFPF
jgi:hypothetical protein